MIYATFEKSYPPLGGFSSTRSIANKGFSGIRSFVVRINFRVS
jgi:hypothetical protein